MGPTSKERGRGKEEGEKRGERERGKGRNV